MVRGMQALGGAGHAGAARGLHAHMQEYRQSRTGSLAFAKSFVHLKECVHEH